MVTHRTYRHAALHAIARHDHDTEHLPVLGLADRFPGQAS